MYPQPLGQTMNELGSRDPSFLPFFLHFFVFLESANIRALLHPILAKSVLLSEHLHVTGPLLCKQSYRCE